MPIESQNLLFLRLKSFLKTSDCFVSFSSFDLRRNLKSEDFAEKSVVCVWNEDKTILVIEFLPKSHDLNLLKQIFVTKFDLYQEAGVLEYWIIDPLRRMVLLYSLVEGKLVTGKPFLEGDNVASKIFPDFSVAVDDIFAE